MDTLLSTFRLFATTKAIYFTAILLLFSGRYSTASAQKSAIWKGGTPGRSSDWNCATNWKEGRVPDEFSNVVIPDVSTSTFCYPIIDQGEVEILSLLCVPSAQLTVLRKARIIVLEPSNFGETIRNESFSVYGNWAGRMVTVGN